MNGPLELTKEVRGSMKSPRIGVTRFFLKDARQEKRSESPENQRLLLAAMAREWKKWEEHKATLPLTQGELRMLWSRFLNLKIVGTRCNDAYGLSYRQS